MAMGGEVDARTDIYSLGCVGYWLLTGHHVFNGESALEIAMHHLQTQPDPPSTRTEIEIPESLDRVILDCLEKDPARRPQNMVELSRRLSTCRLEGRWTAADARRWWTLHMPSE